MDITGLIKENHGLSSMVELQEVDDLFENEEGETDDHDILVDLEQSRVSSHGIDVEVD